MGGRRTLTILGWLVAAVLLILFIVSKYDITFRKKTDVDRPLTSTEAATENASSSPVATKAKAAVQPPVQRTYSTEELFQMASPAVVLVEVYDEEGHKRRIGSVHSIHGWIGHH